ncbi:MAG: hypothetical protein WA941_17435 [Nitrososphaeraceae archaeon]
MSKFDLRKRQYDVLFLLSYAILFILAVSMLNIGSIYQKAFADGLTQENLPPASLGNREGSLFVKISPPIFTTQSEGDAFMQFRLFDAKTNETVQHVTYDIEVSKGANPAVGEKPLVRDFFHAHNGLLTLKVEPTNGSLTILGDRDPFQAAYVADPGGTINLRGPVLKEGGLYKLDVQIFGVDNDRNIFVPDDAPKFETFLSVGDVFNYRNLTFEGKPFNTTLISYYDKIDDFNFNSTTGKFSWSMPFYYDVKRLEKNPIFVHEEIKLPKALFGSSVFNATVNGQPISGRTLAIDPFTSPDAVILHYLINKNDVIKIANEWQQREGSATTTDSMRNSTAATLPVSLESGGGASNSQNESGIMEFALTTTPPENQAVVKGGGAVGGSPSEGQANRTSTTSANTTSTDLLSDTGGIHVNVQWPPAPISMNTSAKFNFTDAFSGGDLNANVMYDISVLDSNGKQVFDKKGMTAKDSEDTQNIKFPAAGTYQLVLAIKGIQQTPNDQKSEAPPVDNTRNGIARGTVVVSGQANNGDQTASVPSAPEQPVTTQQSNNSQVKEQPQQENQIASVPSAPEQPVTTQQSNNSLVEQEQKNPFEQLGQAISNIFGG